ncbi:hypothetical protein B566_EDAN015554 [Ephemera danica]|nr:hypothetical protein B566_EDAN015554 [Ephemera danica]
MTSEGKQAHVDPAFSSIPRNATGFYIWRIENLKVVPLPRDQYGQFYDGDSYIVYAASEYGQPAGVEMKTRELKGQPEVHLHFWLGLETSQDEAGVAAYKTVELDDMLSGSPVQHREVQGKESPRFIAYFTKGIRVMTGGVASGLTKVTDNFKPRLFRSKGRRQPILTEMPGVEWKYFNSGDCFILDTKDVVFIWTGNKANHAEKLHAAKMSQLMKDEHSATGVVFIEEGRETSLPEDEKRALAVFLDPRRAREIGEMTQDDDEKVATQQRQQLRLYHCCDESGTLKVTEKERVEAMRNAHGFVKKKGYPSHTAVTRVIDGGEPVDFKQLFSSWRTKDQMTTTGLVGQLNRQMSSGRIAPSITTKFDADSMHSQPQLAAETQLVDDGSGSKTIWRVHRFQLEAVPEKMQGCFFAGDCYILHYKYMHGAAEKQILYYWLGLESAKDEQGAAALKTIDIDTKEGGAAVQVRVMQGKEPAHFLSLFPRGFVVLSGGYASDFDGDNAKDAGVSKDLLLQVSGNKRTNTRATQVPLRAASLNTNDVFILRKDGTVYIWCGKGATGDEREMAKGVAQWAGSGEQAVIYEGQEKPEFWEAIGGKEPYADTKRLADSSETMPARLFQCSNASGMFRADEIVNFAQTDLIQEDVMLLDAHSAIALWIGKNSRKDEQEAAVALAQEYLRTDPSGRTDAPIFQIKQGYEPPNFIGFFGAWNPNLWNESKSFEDIKAEVKSQNGVIEVKSTSQVNGGTSFDDYPKYPLAILLEKETEKLPNDVNPAYKELHLSKDDFKATIGMDIAEFNALPGWRRANIKKSAGLF